MISQPYLTRMVDINIWKCFGLWYSGLDVEVTDQVLLPRSQQTGTFEISSHHGGRGGKNDRQKCTTVACTIKSLLRKACSC